MDDKAVTLWWVSNAQPDRVAAFVADCAMRVAKVAIHFSCWRGTVISVTFMHGQPICQLWLEGSELMFFKEVGTRMFSFDVAM